MRPQLQGVTIDLVVLQAYTAAMVGGSRQCATHAWRQMHQLGLVDRAPQRLAVRDRARLEDVACGRLALPALGGDDAS
jgi:hypothetical protein